MKITFENKFIDWMSIKVFQHFDGFLIMSNESFDKLESYYELTIKPITNSEIERDYEIREWNSSKSLASILAYGDDESFQNLIMRKMIEFGNLGQELYHQLQTQHLLLYYHLACIVSKDDSISSESILRDQTLEELILVLDVLSIEKYPVFQNKKFNELIKNLQLSSFIHNHKADSSQLDVLKDVEEYYNVCITNLNMVANGHGGYNDQLFRNLESLFEKSKILMESQKNYPTYLEKLGTALDEAAEIEVDAAKYLIKLKTIIAGTITQAGVAKRLGLNKVIKPLLLTLKKEMTSAIYRKISSKALVKLINTDDIQFNTKDKIMK